jgi:hypothetical protein
MVTQYDVEVYQRLEALLGQRLPEYNADEETVRVHVLCDWSPPHTRVMP